MNFYSIHKYKNGYISKNTLFWQVSWTLNSWWELAKIPNKRICLLADGAKNVSRPWLSLLQRWDRLILWHLLVNIHIYINMLNIYKSIHFHIVYWVMQCHNAFSIPAKCRCKLFQTKQLVKIVYWLLYINVKMC